MGYPARDVYFSLCGGAVKLIKFFVLCILLFRSVGFAAELPGDAYKLLPQLSAEIDQTWPDLQPRAFIPALIEQESGWRVRATLQTSRETGCGLGQFTIARNADGSTRFDALAEARRLDATLAGWSWRDCYAVQYQFRAITLTLKLSDHRCSQLIDAAPDIKACDAAIHNGGAGSISKRIKLCSITEGCDPRRWFGHLERQCPQSKVKVQGYAEDFCTINSKYPARVFARMPKYEGRL